jgi:hypothetical protein
MKYLIDEKNKRILRKIFLESLNKETEIAGRFFEIENIEEQVIELNVINEKIEGDKKEGYTICGNDTLNSKYTFHTHCIEVDENEIPINYPNLISNEDLIGIVQDNHSNSGYLSNIDGINYFDILLCPMGIFLYYLKKSIIKKWIKLEDEISNDNVISYLKWFYPNIKNNETIKNDENLILKVKYLIQTDKSEKNQFWAIEENSLMNNKFNKYIGKKLKLNKNFRIMVLL